MAIKTHCPQGHEYTAENTYVDRRGCRNCRECRRQSCQKIRTARNGERLCRTCQRHIPPNVRSVYCAEGCRAVCDVEGCIQKCQGRSDMCGWHRVEVLSKGCATPRQKCMTCATPINRGPGQYFYCSEECRPQCAGPGCMKKSNGRNRLCEAHQEQLRRTGVLRPPRWTADWICVVCGAEVEKGRGRRKHCSGRCQMLDSVNPNRPKSFDCVKCGDTISLIVPSTKTGKFKRADSKLCDKCKMQKKWPVTVGQLAKRDGTDCKICGDLVDLDAGKTDSFRPSVDHVVPRALGGSDDPTNLQLAHLWCNQVKNDRTEFSLMPEKTVAHGN